MKRAYFKYVSAFLVSSYLTAIVPVMASMPTSIIIAQATATYNKHMRNGYTATRNRNYKKALISFRTALQFRPKDRYALQAISNVSYYAKALRSDKTPPAPPNLGAPKNIIGGATRGGSCTDPNGKSLIALIPKGEALTTAKLPTILVYMPSGIDTRVEFSLQDSNEQEAYKTNITPQDSDDKNNPYTINIAPNKNAGIVSLNLATLPEVPSLENGKEYKWYLTLVCNENDHSGDQFVAGYIKKVALDPLLTEELQAAKPGDRAVLYAVNNLWYDALATLYQARLSSPNDAVLSQTWDLWLKSVEIDKRLADNKKLVQQYKELPSEPLTNCCMASSSKVGLNP